MSVIFKNARVVLSTSTQDGAHDVSASTTRVALDRSFDLVDVTRQFDTTKRQLADYEDWSVRLGLLQAFSPETRESNERVDRLLDQLCAVTRSGKCFQVRVLPDASLPRSDTNPEYIGNAVLDGYSPFDAETGDLLKFDVTLIGATDLQRIGSAEDAAHPTDSLKIGMTEAAAAISTITVHATDTLNIKHTEFVTSLNQDNIIAKRTIDSAAVRGTETTKTVITGITASGDAVAVRLTETANPVDTAMNQSKSVTDSCKVGATDSSNIITNKSVTDSLAVKGTDVRETFDDTAILDNLNRADENPLSGGGNWGGVIINGMTDMELVSNVMKAQGSGISSSSAFWNAATFGPRSKAFVTMTALDTTQDSDLWLWICGSGENSVLVSGYQLYVDFNFGIGWQWRVFRYDNGSTTQIGGTFSTQALSAGDKIGLTHDGVQTLSVWYKPSGSTWRLLTTLTSSTYTSGHVGFSIGEASNTITIMDDPGGETY